MKREAVRLLVLASGIAILFTVVWNTFHEDAQLPASVDDVQPANILAIHPFHASVDELRRQTRERIGSHLQSADRESERLIGEHLKDLDGYFAVVKQRTPQFAEAVLGWGSKWRFAADRLPFTRTDRHARYLRELFRTHMFTPECLQAHAQGVVSKYLAAVRAMEGQLMVKIRADVADMPFALTSADVDSQQLHALFEEAMERAAAHTGAGLCDDVVQQLIGLVIGEVMTQAAVRLGVSAGILGTGAASGWETLGISVVAGLIVDQVVSCVWDWWADPTGNLVREMDARIDSLCEAVMEGTPAAPGLRPRLQVIARERAAARRTVVLDLIQCKESGQNKWGGRR